MDQALEEKTPANPNDNGTIPRRSIDELPQEARSPLTSRILSSLSEKGSLRSRSPLRNEFHIEEHPHHYHYHQSGGRPWRRPKSPGLKWHKAYDHQNLTHGRVLVVDYVKQEQSKDGMRKVVAQEINSYEGLNKLYESSNRKDEAVLRLFHVQNAAWAVNFFFKKFNLKPNELVGSDFGSYTKYARPQRRNGRPLLKGRFWPTQHDPVDMTLKQ